MWSRDLSREPGEVILRLRRYDVETGGTVSSNKWSSQCQNMSALPVDVETFSNRGPLLIHHRYSKLLLNYYYTNATSQTSVAGDLNSSVFWVITRCKVV